MRTGTPRPPVLIVSVIIINGRTASPSSDYNVCEISREDNTTTFIESAAFTLSISNVAQTCTTFPNGLEWIDQFGIEVDKDKLNSSKSKHELVVSTVPCKDILTGSENYTSPVFTIVNDNGM